MIGPAQPEQRPASASIRAVIFDFGGVLYRMPSPQHMQRMLRFFGVRDPGPVTMAFASPLESPLVMDIMTGRLPETELWGRLARDLRIRPALLGFFRRSGFTPRRLDRVLSAYLANLRPRYRTAILTNAGSEFRASFGKAYALETLVDHLIISAEEGLAKPDPQLYHLALERIGIAPAEAVFIDDLPENVAAAQAAGLHALLHTNTSQTIAWLEKILH